MGTQGTEKSLLRSIFDLEYFPLEGLVTRNPEHYKKHSKIGNEISYFNEIFNEEDKKRFDKFNSLILETQEEEFYYAYAEGLRAGMILISELVFRKY